MALRGVDRHAGSNHHVGMVDRVTRTDEALQAYASVWQPIMRAKSLAFPIWRCRPSDYDPEAWATLSDEELKQHMAKRRAALKHGTARTATPIRK